MEYSNRPIRLQEIEYLLIKDSLFGKFCLCYLLPVNLCQSTCSNGVELAPETHLRTINFFPDPGGCSSSLDTFLTLFVNVFLSSGPDSLPLKRIVSSFEVTGPQASSASRISWTEGGAPIDAPTVLPGGFAAPLASVFASGFTCSRAADIARKCHQLWQKQFMMQYFCLGLCMKPYDTSNNKVQTAYR